MNNDLAARMKEFLTWYLGATQAERSTLLKEGLMRFIPEAFPPPTIDECDIVELRRRAHAAVDFDEAFATTYANDISRTTAARILLTGSGK